MTLQPATNGKLTILVVEDNKDMRDYIRSILVYVYGRDRKMDVRATLLPNQTEGITEGDFHYPNLLIKRKVTK